MHNVPNHVADRIRKFEGHPHSIIHVLLWICCPDGVDFDSQTASQSGASDIVLINKYRHYIKLKVEGGNMAQDAVLQIHNKNYHTTYPRAESNSQKLAFYYGVKWKNKSTHAIVEVWADKEAQKLEENIVCRPTYIVIVECNTSIKLSFK